MNNQEIIEMIQKTESATFRIDGLGETTIPTKELKFLVDALEKQIPKKPKNIRNITFTGSAEPNFSEGECPNCGEYVDTDDNKYVCGQSGCYQAIDWSVEE